MKLFKLTLTVAIVALLSNAAMATTWYSQGTHDWGTNNAWNTTRNGSGVDGNPADGDKVVIQDGHTVTIASTTNSVEGVYIEDGVSGGTINMRSSGNLKVREYITNNAAFIFGESTNSTPVVTADATSATACEIRGVFTMSGSKGGQFTITADSGNSFKVESREEVIFEDAYDIDIAASIENDGIIHASDAGDITFSTEVSNNSTGLFRVTHADAIMKFDMENGAANMTSADFKISAGAMYFHESVQTSGGFQQTGGTVQVDAGKSFTATGAY
jgi:hypothetical protein